MILYRFLQGTLVTTIAVLAYFFIVGLGDGSVGAFNMHLWVMLLGIPVAALVGAARLLQAGRQGAAWLVLAIPAAPALLYGLFVLLVVILQPDFR